MEDRTAAAVSRSSTGSAVSLDRQGGRHFHAAALAIVLVISFALSLQNLGHAAVKPLDEVFHAIVARNLMHHPLRPMLDDPPYVATDYHSWQDCGPWMLKPPMSMWQIACSYAALGVNSFSLRLPSAILAALSAWLTYLIGAQLIDRTAGLAAAILQAFNPAILMTVHGYVFSDHVDISLLFWTELSMLFLVRLMRSGRKSDAILCGIAQALAFLSKTYPAFIVTAVAFVIWLAPRTPLVRQNAERVFKLTGRSLLIIIVTTIVTLLPWTIYALIRYPHEFLYFNAAILSHLNKDVEGWAAPWDRLIFDFSIRIYHVFYVPVLAAAVIVAVRAWQRRDIALWMVLAWALGVLLPHTLATSKTMTATMVGWPPFWILLGALVSLALRGDRSALSVWLVSMLTAVIFIGTSDIPREGWGYPATRGFGVIMREHIWVIRHLLIALGGGGSIAWLMHLFRGNERALRRLMIGISTAAMVLLMVRWWPGAAPRGYGYVCWQVTRLNKMKPDFATLVPFASALPSNAVFLVDENDRAENKLIQFAVDRTCHPVARRAWQDLARQVAANGGLPFLITSATLGQKPVYIDSDDKQFIYACTPEALNAAAIAARTASLSQPPVENP